VTPRAGGTGRTGGAVPLAGGVVLAFEAMNRIKGIEPRDLIAVVEPGVVTGELHRAVEELGLFYPPDPNSLSTCALGGNVAENAGGPRALRYGSTRDYVLGLNVVTPDGSELTLGKRTPKGVTGYDLTSLLVGSEGTLAITTEITLKLLPKPQAVATMLVLLPTLASAGAAVTQVLGAGILPRCMELLDDKTLDLVRPLSALPISPSARALLLIELDGDELALEGQLERAGNAVDAAGATEVLVARHGGEREKLWAARRELSRALRASARFKLAEDVVVPRSKIPALIEECARISERFAVPMASYGHAGDGNLHVNFLWNDEAQAPTVKLAIGALFEHVIELGGTLTGEHGIGVLKAPYLHLEQSPQVIALQERVKDLFDPKRLLNPGKIFASHLQRFHGAC
ncbi:MAG TPA: FAD-linked oxidase C-terminal domain-containing protein, partial [Polyangiales bacterium]|nr:FAD-linked oxidase C-terminal domain-containing protein [Polyangiales bacterium]